MMRSRTLHLFSNASEISSRMTDASCEVVGLFADFLRNSDSFMAMIGYEVIIEVRRGWTSAPIASDFRVLHFRRKAIGDPARVLVHQPCEALAKNRDFAVAANRFVFGLAKV